MKPLYLVVGLILSVSLGYAQDDFRTAFKIDTVYFKFDSFDLSDDAAADLDSLTNVFLKYPTYFVEIFGHTDSIGTTAYNLELSQERARAVAIFLGELGVSLDRISYEGLGTNKPVANNDTYAGRRKNRRADIAVVFSNQPYVPPQPEPDTTPVVVQIDPASITDTLFVDYDPFSINPKHKTVIFMPKKSVLVIPPDAFESDAESLTVKVGELFSRRDMIVATMPTIAKAGPLEMQGVVDFTVRDNRRAARVKDNVSFELRVPATRRDAYMGVWKGRGGGRGFSGRGKKIEGETPSVGPVKSWDELDINPRYLGQDKLYAFEVPGPGTHGIGRMLYYALNTDRDDDGINLRVKLKGKRYRQTEVLLVGEKVKTYIPLRKQSERWYQGRRIKFLNEDERFILLAIQYDDEGDPWLARLTFKPSLFLGKKRSKKNPEIKLKLRFRKLTPEELEETLTELNV